MCQFLKYVQLKSRREGERLRRLCRRVGIIELFALCKGGNFNIHIWVWFGYFICLTREIGSFDNLVKN